MDLSILLQNIVPLYGLIALGWVAGRYLDVNLHSVARINLFILLPMVTFGGIIKIDFNPAYILLPIILGACSVVATFLSFNTAKRFFRDGRENLIGAATVNGNALYFGLPIILFLFGKQWGGIYILMNIGPMLSNMILANFITARGRYDIKKSILKVLKFPAVHAAWIAAVLNMSGVKIHNDIAWNYWGYAAGALLFLGMMMIGIGLSKLEKFQIDWAFLCGLFLSKHILWPAIATGFILFDTRITHLFTTEIHQMMLLWSSMPVMGNLVAYASEYELYPEKAATGVLLSSLFGLVSIPVAYVLMGIIL